MLFRTKFLVALIGLVVVAVGCAGLLILSAQRSAQYQTRMTLAHESLAGYLELSGSIFRTFKQARRDLISGDGAFAFDIDTSRSNILVTLSAIESASQAEAELTSAAYTFNVMENVAALRREITQALDDIEQASVLVQNGEVEAGRAMAIRTLEGQVDAEIARLMEEAIQAEQLDLLYARDATQRFHQWAQRWAWTSVVVALLLSALVLITLMRRFSSGLKKLEQAAQEYSDGNLSHVIDLPGSDELSDVANRFSTMAQQIQSKQLALEDAQHQLERRVAERTAEISEVNGELQERDRLRRQFFADIGHELRTPVTAIRGEAEVALRARENVPSVQRNALEKIVSVSEQLTNNVSDIFLIAREQAGVLDFRNNALNLNTSVRAGISQMQSVAMVKQGRISQSMHPSPLEIEGDHNRIAQLVGILISNALTHGPQGVNIQVATELEDDFAVLSISDNGPGIAERDRKRIFDRYARGSMSGTRSTSGTGLGLAIAKSIALAHGGGISVGPSPLGGAQFNVRFPLMVDV